MNNACMEPFKPIPQCVECLKALGKSSAVLADSKNPRLQEQVEALVGKVLGEAEENGSTSPQIARRILREIKRLSGVADPYAQFKHREMAHAQEILAGLPPVGPDLRSRVNLAVLGNSLDFFENPGEALSGIPDLLQKGLPYFIDDVDRLETFLTRGLGLVLYICDNAGEIYFDLPLYEFIKRRSERAVLVVKGGPSLNDLTRSELQVAELENRLDEVADLGTDGPGVDWDLVSKEFLDLVREADLIISKGMANFESLFPEKLSSPVFFLFKIKCQPIQDYLNAPAGSFCALWHEKEPI